MLIQVSLELIGDLKLLSFLSLEGAGKGVYLHKAQVYQNEKERSLKETEIYFTGGLYVRKQML